MTWFDYAVLAVLAASVLMSLVHGLVREILALASWVVAFLLAQLFATDVALLLPAAISNPSLRLLVAFIVVFLTTLVFMTLLAIAISRMVRNAGLGGTDRLLGAAFGFLRGLAIVMVGVLLAGLTTLPKQEGWQRAVSSPPLEALANIAKGWLPHDLANRISYD